MYMMYVFWESLLSSNVHVLCCSNEENDFSGVFHFDEINKRGIKACPMKCQWDNPAQIHIGFMSTRSFMSGN